MHERKLTLDNGSSPKQGVTVVLQRGGVDVKILEQPVSVVILLLLLLVDGGEALSCFFLPLRELVKSVPDLLLSFLDGGEPGVETSVVYLLLMISHGRWMMTHVTIMQAHGVVVEAMSEEGHASSLEATRNLLR
jgi:hypothetical protein